MNSFMIAANAVIPFICYMLYGFIICRLGLGDDKFYNKLNKVVFKAFFPLLMFNNIYSADIDLGSNLSLIMVFCGVMMAIILLSMILVPLIVKENPKRGVVIQSIWRSNTLMFAYPLCVTMYGDEWGAVASLVIATVVPIYNICTVMIFSVFDRKNGSKTDLKKILKNIITNPLIVGAIIGGVFKLTGWVLPQSIEKPVEGFANMTTPLSILILGATLNIPDIGKNMKYIVSVLSLKLVIVPGIVTVIMYMAGFRGPELFIAFILYATPIAGASFPMAQNMGGDGDLQGQLLAISTVLSLFTIFFWIAGLTAAGIF
ncbi:AEC family transporter [Oribacterium sp. P6A1]|uniref:AEC family transporter n=1 Tax=Oribacterium sp. P6A1 TaxID=1410612 RepID=UPI00056965DA|nr:AEC family transporter [Oribacterium sp. P6A1]